MVCICAGEDGYDEYAKRAKTHELKNIDQRVRTGDLSQVDLPDGQPSGLADAVGRLNNVEGVGINHLSGKDVVRHPVVARILQAYESDS